MKTILITYLLIGLIPNAVAIYESKNIISIWRKHYLLYTFFMVLDFLFWPIIFYKAIWLSIKGLFKKKSV